MNRKKVMVDYYFHDCRFNSYTKDSLIDYNPIVGSSKANKYAVQYTTSESYFRLFFVVVKNNNLFSLDYYRMVEYVSHRTQTEMT